MARECGIKYNKNGFSVTGQFEIWHKREWTIERAECREVIREKFKIETLYDYGTNTWHGYELGREKSKGETIQEAEIATIMVLCENND